MAITVKTLTTGEKLFYVGQTDTFLGWEDLRYAMPDDGTIEAMIITKRTGTVQEVENFMNCFRDDGGGVIMLTCSDAFADVLADVFGEVLNG
jgi:hypothetical protein